MPELPEVETVRLGRAAAVVGRRVERVEVTGKRSVRRQTKAAFTKALRGRTFAGAKRRGKYLLVPLDDGAVLVAHLRMSGQLVHVVDAGLERVPHTHVVLGLDDGSELRFVDPRTFGELFVAAEVGPDGVPAVLAGLGTDPLVDGLPAQRLGELLRKRRTTLKAFLLDQRLVAGIGNLYADEICHAAGLHPSRRTETLGAGDVERLASAVDGVLAEAVRLRGSSLRDARYRDLAGALGGYQARHAVYDRTGQPCPSCGAAVERIRVAGRSAHFCPACQS